MKYILFCIYSCKVKDTEESGSFVGDLQYATHTFRIHLYISVNFDNTI